MTLNGVEYDEDVLLLEGLRVTCIMAAKSGLVAR